MRSSCSATSGTARRAASVGVDARTSATRSSSGTSCSWPMALTTGVTQPATARTSSSSENGSKSSAEPPPRAMMITSTAGSASSRCSAPTTSSLACGPCTATCSTRNWTAGHRCAAFCGTSRSAAESRPQIRPTDLGRNGSGRLRSAANSPSAARAVRSRSMRASRSPMPTDLICAALSANEPFAALNSGLAQITTRLPSPGGGLVASSTAVVQMTRTDTAATGSRRTRKTVPPRLASSAIWPSTQTRPRRPIHSPTTRRTVRTGTGDCSEVSSGTARLLSCAGWSAAGLELRYAPLDHRDDLRPLGVLVLVHEQGLELLEVEAAQPGADRGDGHGVVTRKRQFVDDETGPDGHVPRQRMARNGCYGRLPSLRLDLSVYHARDRGRRHHGAVTGGQFFSWQQPDVAGLVERPPPLAHRGRRCRCGLRRAAAWRCVLGPAWSPAGLRAVGGKQDLADPGEHRPDGLRRRLPSLISDLRDVHRLIVLPRLTARKSTAGCPQGYGHPDDDRAPHTTPGRRSGTPGPPVLPPVGDQHARPSARGRAPTPRQSGRVGACGDQFPRHSDRSPGPAAVCAHLDWGACLIRPAVYCSPNRVATARASTGPSRRWRRRSLCSRPRCTSGNRSSTTSTW